MEPVTALAVAMLMSGAAAAADACPPHPGHYDGHDCVCSREVTFYGPWTPAPPVYVTAPGVRVFGRPVEVAGPVVYISAPPVYVDAPPIRVAPAQIYVQRPDVHVRPSEILIEPPQVHFADCPAGSVCTAAPGH